MKIDIPIEAIAQVVHAVLLDEYQMLVKNPPQRMFSLDEKQDKKQVKKLIKAIERVLDYYGGIPD